MKRSYISTYESNPCETPERVTAIVVGAGAAGIAVLGNLLELLNPKSKILWVDPNFRAGRIHSHYREVPGNTRAGLFLDYFVAVDTFRYIDENSRRNFNHISKLRKLPQDETCSLGHAADALLTLTAGLHKHPRVKLAFGIAADVEWRAASASWKMRIDNSGGTSKFVEAPMVVYCTGSAPTVVPLPVAMPHQPIHLDLDIALKPSQLECTLPWNRPICVGVVGASHSAVLVLMNLITLQRERKIPQLRIRWFTRTANLRYAEDRGDWVLFDNTGLKGEASHFAREYLEGDKISQTFVGDIITRVLCAGGPDTEIPAYHEMAGCDYLVQAIGYTRNPLPSIHNDLRFNHETGCFMENMANNPVPGLFGAGIAFPERVVDPDGNVEMAVGFVEFMRFLKRVMPNWVGSISGVSDPFPVVNPKAS
ncbi:S-methyl-5-thioadenosine phosphorylase [Hypoxylon texense]